ncbi:MAG: aspartyl/glutamyl-tRNA amidotransferase subunit B [Nitrospirae bacterium RIFCSPHIGHO2_01_FULL_66_17]|nr:MAG: aspartyl/glutamyl-tRNA amidotransferase subunit B [Nitrospirae bacterium RIFCSPHIGHO2_01_FULL_66_17]
MTTITPARTAYETVIGLEVHAQLLTRSKMFCGCATAFGAEPNTQVCPICLGMPGVLPVVNKRAVEFAVRLGLAVHATIAASSRFARKNYFYPDLPKGYQISQYELPICEGGWLDIAREATIERHARPEGAPKRIRLTRAHLEEDAGKNLHDVGDGASHVDLNRAGTPLLEIVSEPDLRSADEAVAYLKALRELVVYLGICDGNMEEGSFRCDANVSIRPAGSETLNTRVELKNINSFRYVKRAIEYEVERQIGVVEDGGRIVQETRLFDPQRGVSVTMRSKEAAHDYRYFPEPDLVPIAAPAAWIAEIRAALPELPEAKRARFAADHGLSAYDATVLTGSRALADYFEATLRHGAPPKTAANWIMGELLALLNAEGAEIDTCRVTPKSLAALFALIDAGTISGKIAKTVFEEMYRTGAEADAVVAARGLTQVSDAGELAAVIDQVIADSPKELAQYRAGKDKLFGHFVGQVMKRTQGKANPAKVNELLKARLAP